MTVAQMRAKISKVYPGDIWKNKVYRMHEDQVIAIYFKFLETGKFDQKAKVQKKPPMKFGMVSGGEQLSFFD